MSTTQARTYFAFPASFAPLSMNGRGGVQQTYFASSAYFSTAHGGWVDALRDFSVVHEVSNLEGMPTPAPRWGSERSGISELRVVPGLTLHGQEFGA